MKTLNRLAFQATRWKVPTVSSIWKGLRLLALPLLLALSSMAQTHAVIQQARKQTNREAA